MRGKRMRMVNDEGGGRQHLKGRGRVEIRGDMVLY